MTLRPTKPIRITPFVAFLASGSEISDPSKDSGYSPALAAELARIGTRGGTVRLSAGSLEDLAEWLDAMYAGERDGGSPAGANSCAKTAEKARTYARQLREQDQDQTTNTKEASMATKVTRKKGSAKATETTKTEKVATNGKVRRTAEDWDALAEEIRAKRQAGTTMQALKQEYGTSSDVPLREALARAGYNSKGEELEYEDISSLKGAPLKNRVVKERNAGTAWYMIALMTGKGEAELRELAGEAGSGGGGRVAKAEDTAEKAKASGAKATNPKASAGKKVTRKGAKTKANPS